MRTQLGLQSQLKDTSIINDPFIWYKDNVLSESFCKETIEKFERSDSPDKLQGRAGYAVNTQIKESLDLFISNKEEWKYQDNILEQTLYQGIQEYIQSLNEKLKLPLFNSKLSDFGISIFVNDGEQHQVFDSGYQIQRTSVGKGYSWHDDFCTKGMNNEDGPRYLTFIWYLNTVDEGWTQFYNGSQVSPKRGRLLLFPSSWTYIHQGYPPKQTKYIITGWIQQTVSLNGQTINYG